MHAVRGRILQEGKIFTLSEFDKFYMVLAILDATNAMELSISPSEFYIFDHFLVWRYKTPFCN